MVLSLRMNQHPVIKMGFLYNDIDESNEFFRCHVEKSVRSLMNVPFTLEKMSY
ncbi:putative phosphoserine transaminase [Medicago truncatula]|uniref:Putative phosphoserine transaminase n=1 Tax=Medicago truncatula TaxID=3880 RepID=A0A396I4Z1_MEDTR|nr:putative phosphoserine transaminase [Medicago truncatula]